MLFCFGVSCRHGLSSLAVVTILCISVFSLEQGLEEMKKLLLLLLGCAVQVRAQFTSLKQFTYAYVIQVSRSRNQASS